MPFSDIFKNLKNLGGNLIVIWNTIRHAYDYVKNFINHLLTLFSRIENLISDIENEIHAIEEFTFNPTWRTRVISVPRAYEKINRLATQIPREITTAIKDIVSQIKSKLEASTGGGEDFNEAELENDLKLLPEKLAKCGEKILGFVTLITDSIVSISAVVDDLQTLVSDFREIREDIENLDAIFLPKGGQRKIVDIRYRKRNG